MSIIENWFSIAIEQIVTDGENHHCMICHKFADKDAKKVEVHIVNSHKRILALIYEEKS